MWQGLVFFIFHFCLATLMTDWLIFTGLLRYRRLVFDNYQYCPLSLSLCWKLICLFVICLLVFVYFFHYLFYSSVHALKGFCIMRIPNVSVFSINIIFLLCSATGFPWSVTELHTARVPCYRPRLATSWPQIVMAPLSTHFKVIEFVSNKVAKMFPWKHVSRLQITLWV